MKEPLWRNLLLSVWEIWERFFSKLYHIQKIQPDGLFRLNTSRYRGPDLELSDGTLIRPGDLVGELHLSNRDALRLQLKYNSRVRSTMAVKKELARDLACLASRVTADQEMPDVKAYFGITLFHQGMRSLGFEVKEFDNRMLRWLYMKGQRFLLAIYHPAGINRFHQGHQELAPKYIWISSQKLLHDFLPPKQNGG